MKIEQIDIEKLIPYARNAKLHSERQVQAIAGSIQAFGFNNPVLIDVDNGIIAGHGRVMAAQLLRIAKIPCVRLAHLSENDKRAYVIADNKLQEIGGGWDQELLDVEIDSLHDFVVSSGCDFGGIFSKQTIELLTDDKAGASPWDRVADASSGIVFHFGDKCERVDDVLYEKFLAKIGNGSVKGWLDEIFNT